MWLRVYQSLTLMSSTPQHDKNQKAENVAFKLSVWVSVAAAVIVGIIAVWYYRGILF